MNWVKLARSIYQKTKRSLEWPVFIIFDYLALAWIKPRRSTNPKTAIVHLELLGDFFIWLPYGQAMTRKMAANSESEIVIIVERQLAELAKATFSEHAVFPVSRREFLRSPLVRWRTLRALRKLGVHACFHPGAPRDALLQDAIVHALGVPALGFDSVLQDRPCADIAISQRFYRHLLPDQPNVHQQVRYRYFLDAIEVPLVLSAVLPAQRHPMREKGYIIVAPGGSRAFRQWPAENFAELAKRLLLRYPDWHCVIVGSNNDYALANRVRGLIGGSSENLCGQTGILELCAWIEHAQLVICNDSAPGHIAAAYGVQSLVITGGGHWQRCYPYDEDEAPIRSRPLVVSNPMHCFGCNWLCLYSLQYSRPFPCISAVTVESAWQQLRRNLPWLATEEPRHDAL